MANRNQQPLHQLPGDSKDYEMIREAIGVIPSTLCGMTCEIGLRQGGGTKHIINALASRDFPYKVHVAVDPYGNIDYARKAGIVKKMNYTNQMRDESIGHIYNYAMKHKVNMVFINLEDIEFFQRYSDGVPVYNEDKHVLNEYMFVHFDGPHDKDPVMAEFKWFDERMKPGAVTVFDDVSSYDHDAVEKVIFDHGWNLLNKTKYKASYQK